MDVCAAGRVGAGGSSARLCKLLRIAPFQPVTTSATRFAAWPKAVAWARGVALQGLHACNRTGRECGRKKCTAVHVVGAVRARGVC